jgi:hypothetical protein
MTNLHDGSAGDPRPIPDTVTVNSILDRFARKLTELNDRNVRGAGRAGTSRSKTRETSLQADPRARGHVLETFSTWGEGGENAAEATGAHVIAFLLARARVDDSRVDLAVRPRESLRPE